MAAITANDHRDIRSASLLSKRDKEHNQKWKYGERLMPGVRRDHATDLPCGGSNPEQLEKLRPQSPWGRTGLKSNANKAPKQYGGSWKGMELNRGNVARKIHATIDVNEHNAAPLSKSLLGILPQHVNNTDSAIRTAIRDSASAVDGDILYSFDNKGPSPGSTGRNIDLGGLVDLAEKKWANDQIEKIVNGEYEVLDDQGEITVLKKGKRSPKQKAAKVTPAIPKTFGKAEDDGFELI